MVAQVLSYVTDDGRRWDTLEQAEAWERRLAANKNLEAFAASEQVDLPGGCSVQELASWLKLWAWSVACIAAGGTVEEALKP